MISQYLLALTPLAVIVFVWLLNRKLTKQIRQSEESAKKAYQQAVQTAEQLSKIQGVHEQVLSEIHHGVTDDRASRMLSSGPND